MSAPNPSEPEPTESLPRCLRCLRPQPLCYCDDLPTVDTRTRVVILQHPHERTHPFGTARLARLCLPNSSVHVPTPGYTGTLEQRVDVPDDAAVLFPHPDADDLAELPPEQWPSTLIAIDGTWSHAKRLYRENAWLRGHRHVRLQPASPSNYRIRREPKPEYISTIEAIVEALRILEPGHERLDELLAAFDGMIDRQIAHRSSRRVSRFKSARRREPKAISPLLHDPRLVVVYAETSPLEPGEPADAPRELLHWVAARVDDGATFEACIRPERTRPSDEHLRHMGVVRADLAEPLAAAQERFRAFAADGAPFASWTPTSLGWGRPMLPQPFAHTLLKINYCNHAQRSSGLIEQTVAREGMAVPQVPCRGRAGARLAHALAVARWLRAQAPAGGDAER
ncbi:MAG: DTW domain-containing protein [Planctomycetes bacterium]|nr:DTW domain-containing protein [Planctomycetota bacterium]